MPDVCGHPSGEVMFGRCAACGARVIPPGDVEALADLIAEARDEYPRIATDMDSGELAEKVLASPWLAAHVAAARAEEREAEAAWDEGYEACLTDTEARSAPPGPNGPVDPTMNPYRALLPAPESREGETT